MAVIHTLIGMDAGILCGNEGLMCEASMVYREIIRILGGEYTFTISMHQMLLPDKMQE